MKAIKISVLSLSVMVILAVLFFACKKSVSDSPSLTSGAGKISTLDPLSLTCSAGSGASIDVTVCAGASGAAAGFSVQWETLEDYNNGPDGIPGTKDDKTWASTAPSYGCASLSGNPACSGSNKYNLAANACTTVNVGANLFDDCGASATCRVDNTLKCGTTYIFRAFAHNVPGGLKASDKSGTTQCTTSPCGGEGCTLTQGYWKTHGPEGCVAGNNTNQWYDAITDPANPPVQVLSLTLGTVTYTDLQICSIFNTPASGNGLISLAHQLIAAKLNILKGSDPSSIQSSIDAADALIGGLVIPPVGSGSLAASATSDLVTALTNYNEGATGPGHCNE